MGRGRGRCSSHRSTPRCAAVPPRPGREGCREFPTWVCRAVLIHDVLCRLRPATRKSGSPPSFPAPRPLQHGTTVAMHARSTEFRTKFHTRPPTHPPHHRAHLSAPHRWSACPGGIRCTCTHATATTTSATAAPPPPQTPTGELAHVKMSADQFRSIFTVLKASPSAGWGWRWGVRAGGPASNVAGRPVVCAAPAFEHGRPGLLLLRAWQAAHMLRCCVYGSAARQRGPASSGIACTSTHRARPCASTRM